MAKNKTELDSYVDTYIVPTVTNTIHRDTLKEFSDSSNLKRHRVGSISGSVTLNFLNVESYSLSITGKSSVLGTVSNLQIGQSGYLFITGSGSSLITDIAFTNATLKIVNKSAYSLDNLSPRCIKITNFNGTYIAEYCGSDNLPNNTGFDFETLEGFDLELYCEGFSNPMNGPATPLSGNSIPRCKLTVIKQSTRTIFKILTNNYTKTVEYLGYMTSTTSLVWEQVTST